MNDKTVSDQDQTLTTTLREENVTIKKGSIKTLFNDSLFLIEFVSLLVIAILVIPVTIFLVMNDGYRIAAIIKEEDYLSYINSTISNNQSSDCTIPFELRYTSKYIHIIFALSIIAPGSALYLINFLLKSKFKDFDYPITSIHKALNLILVLNLLLYIIITIATWNIYLQNAYQSLKINGFRRGEKCQKTNGYE